jgi:hypothetical protein
MSKIEAAQRLLNEAVQACSPLQGWADEEPRGPYYLIRDQANATHDLWRKIAYGPEPTGHDAD